MIALALNSPSCSTSLLGLSIYLPKDGICIRKFSFSFSLTGKYFDLQSLLFLHQKRYFLIDQCCAALGLNCEISEEWGREDAAPP